MTESRAKKEPEDKDQATLLYESAMNTMDEDGIKTADFCEGYKSDENEEYSYWPQKPVTKVVNISSLDNETEPKHILWRISDNTPIIKLGTPPLSPSNMFRRSIAAVALDPHLTSGSANQPTFKRFHGDIPVVTLAEIHSISGITRDTSNDPIPPWETPDSPTSSVSGRSEDEGAQPPDSRPPTPIIMEDPSSSSLVPAGPANSRSNPTVFESRPSELSNEPFSDLDEETHRIRHQFSRLLYEDEAREETDFPKKRKFSTFSRDISRQIPARPQAIDNRHLLEPDSYHGSRPFGGSEERRPSSFQIHGLPRRLTMHPSHHRSDIPFSKSINNRPLEMSSESHVGSTLVHPSISRKGTQGQSATPRFLQPIRSPSPHAQAVLKASHNNSRKLSGAASLTSLSSPISTATYSGDTASDGHQPTFPSDNSHTQMPAVIYSNSPRSPFSDTSTTSQSSQSTRATSVVSSTSGVTPIDPRPLFVDSRILPCPDSNANNMGMSMPSTHQGGPAMSLGQARPNRHFQRPLRPRTQPAHDTATYTFGHSNRVRIGLPTSASQSTWRHTPTETLPISSTLPSSFRSVYSSTPQVQATITDMGSSIGAFGAMSARTGTELDAGLPSIHETDKPYLHSNNTKPPETTLTTKPSTTSNSNPQSTSRKSGPASPKQKGPFVCKYSWCGRSFTRKYELIRHENTAAIHVSTAIGDSSTRCQYCNENLSRSDARKRHELRGACGKRTIVRKSVVHTPTNEHNVISKI